jgi:cytolysin-activating lysine-acyltransferase
MNDGIKNPRPMRDIRMAPRPAARPAATGYGGDYDTGLSHDELKWAQVTRAMARQQLEDAARAEHDLEIQEQRFTAPPAPRTATQPEPVTPKPVTPRSFAPRAAEVAYSPDFSRRESLFAPSSETPARESKGFTAPSFRPPPPAEKPAPSHPALVRNAAANADAAKPEPRKFEPKAFEPRKTEPVKEEPRSLFEPSKPARTESKPATVTASAPVPKAEVPPVEKRVEKLTPVNARSVSELPVSVPAPVRDNIDQKMTEARAKLHESFGMVVLALAATPRYRHIGLGELVPMVFEPMMRDRVAIALSGADEESAKTGNPAAVALWATVSEEVDAKIKEQVAAGVFPLRLKPEDWNSGEITWLFDIVAPTPQMRATVLTSFKQLMKSKELRLHPIVTKLVDAETLKKMGIEQIAAPAPKASA